MLTSETGPWPPGPRQTASEKPGAVHFFGVAGVLRLAALWLNDHIDNGITRPNGADVRVVCSGLGARVMTPLTLALEDHGHA